MKKIFAFLLSLISLITIHLSLITPVRAQGDFETSLVLEYKVSDTGQTTVSHTITLTNLTTAVHAVSYSLAIEGLVPTNIRAIGAGKELPTTITSEVSKTNIKVDFPDAVVGKGKSRAFTILYENSKIAAKNGQVWEITIPKVASSDQYSNLEVLITTPKTFGQPAYISPKPAKTLELEDHLTFIYGKSLSQSGIVAAFGRFQIFTFQLSYHLKNELTTVGATEVAFPPDTAFQRVYYESIEPKPISIKVDRDGNWLGTYKLKPGEQMDIKVTGAVQIFTSPQDFYPKQKIDPATYLKPGKYWETTNFEVAKLAVELKTPKSIYEYVVKTLSYDYDRVQEGVERLGAVQILKRPQNAICTEFTDLFIALARAAGIPAREINGFAYTENPQIQPLSLVADVLHAWPEYWDEERGIWIPVDPTWANTTGGVDYFSKFDLSHITFAIHGNSSTEPLPAGSYKLAQNPQKDVIVFFGNLPAKTSPNLKLNVILGNRILPFLPLSGNLILENEGPLALYNFKISSSATKGDVKLNKTNIGFLAPFGTLSLPFSWQTGFLLLGKTDTLPQVRFLAENSQISYNLPREFLVWEIITIFLGLLIMTTILLSPLLIKKKFFLKFAKILPIQRHDAAKITQTR